MTAASAILAGRIAAEANFTDTCTVTRPDPDAVQGPIDPDTLQYPPFAQITIYTGPCRVQIKSIIAASSDATAGERAGTVQEFEWQGPVVGTEGVAINDTVLMVTAPLDESLVGRVFTVKARHEKSQATARRLRVIEVTG